MTDQTDLTKFSSQADPKVLSTMKAIAKSEGRQLQHLLDEAMRQYIDNKLSGRARPHVKRSLDQSMKQFDTLYTKLAQ